ncbi:MAG: L-seryl-tRNA(Sec) selenium transferase, partial [Spirochaetaceae bacterium]|nr:L-seryl-tRNA(Sec) selenium transferase [Spirochaetaceae bacterium]
NMGRSPIAAASWEAAREVNAGYCNVELDLDSGERGGRGGLVALLAAQLAGAESAIALNNNAGAVLLALSALAAGREVVVSRGEQVQIGGGFRIPEILALSGARLVEVGTTNVTTIEDYIEAIGPDTAAVLCVHASNFAIRGFSEKPSIARLAAALPQGLPLIVDQGSGCHTEGLPGEVPMGRLIRDGASLVCFSCDKLLGGPQAGVAAGKFALVARLAAHPLTRALRPGKTILSLLEDRLVRALNGEAVTAAPPDLAKLESFGKRVMRKLPAGRFRLVPSIGTTGGGSSPDEGFPSRSLELLPEAAEAAGGAERVRSALRAGDPPLIAAMRDGELRVDLAGLVAEESAEIAALLARVLPPEEPSTDDAPARRGRPSGAGRPRRAGGAKKKAPREEPREEPHDAALGAPERGLLARAL